MAKNSKRNKTEMLNSSGSSGSGGSSSGSPGNDTILILNAIKESLEVLSKRFEKQEQSILKLENTLTEMRSQINEQAEAIAKLRDENIKMQGDITKLFEYQHKVVDENDKTKAELNELKQDRLMRDVLITNLPINNNFNTTQIVETIFQTLHCDIGTVANQYSILRNKTASNRNYHHINVTFVSEDAKETFLKRKKNNGPILWQQLLPVSVLTEDNKLHEVYVNEKLTYYNLEVLRETRRKQKSGMVRYAWHQRGSVLIRKTEGGKITKILSLNHLEEVCATMVA
jgi:hypothetical protein